MGGFFARRASGAGAASGCMKLVARPCKIGCQTGMTLQKIQRQSAKETQIAVIFFSESGCSQNIPVVCKTDFAVLSQVF